MEKWRLLKLGEVDGYRLNASIEAFGVTRSKGLIDNTLTLCRPKNFVWLGKNAALSHVNTLFCEENNIPIVRCIMGGGAILYGGQCEYTLVVSKTNFPDVSVAFDLFIRCVIQACRILGLPADRRKGSNDVLVRGKKIVGAGIGALGDALVFTGNIVLDFDYDLAGNALTIPPEKFKDKTAKSVDEWVTSVKAELNRDVSFEEAEAALMQGFAEVLQVEFEVADSLTEAEKQILEELGEKYRSEEWLKYGKWSPVKDYWRPK